MTLLPPYTRFFGALTQKRILRLLSLYLILILVGSCLFIFTSTQKLQILGLGLILPGGGFFGNSELFWPGENRHLFAVLASLTLFVMSLGFWFGTGNICAPVLAWLATAIWAAIINHDAAKIDTLLALYSFVGLALLIVIVILRIRYVLAKRQRHIDNAYLLAKQTKLDDIFIMPTVPDSTPELSLEDLQRLRFALDRALQPIEEFNGFEWLDQFQTAAVRYQVNTLAYGIAMAQAHFTPAFTGYLNAAQTNLLDKQANHKVWSYWWLENLWGNLRLDADPIKRENIMYTGFVALQMALYEASTGYAEFSNKGRFKLVHPSGKNYAYDYAAFIECLEKEYQLSEFFLIACEPNWIYPLCNTIGASAILAFDNQKGQAKWKQYEKEFRHYLDAEFLDAFGRYVPCRSARTGLALPAIGGIMPLAMPCFFLNAIAPDLAIRQWLLLRRQIFDKNNRFCRKNFWRIDTGNYRFSRASAYSVTALAAAELGDLEVYDNCMMALEDECPSQMKEGTIHRERSSVWSHGIEIMARATFKDSFRSLIHHPKNFGNMRLDDLSYPEVLVASAHADQDSLNAVLYPGHSGDFHEIGFAGLHPMAYYQISGSTTTNILADSYGKARFKLKLEGRTSLTIYPKGML